MVVKTTVFGKLLGRECKIIAPASILERSSANVPYFDQDGQYLLCAK